VTPSQSTTAGAAGAKPEGRTRLELGVLRGALLSERFDLAESRDPETLPTYFLYRMSVLNYLLRNYAPLDRRLRAIARLQGQVPRYLRQFRASVTRRLPETYYEMAEMAARGIADQYEREVPDHAAKGSRPVRRLLERTNAAAGNEMKILVNELQAKFKPRVKKEFALGRRKYERMTNAEHLAAIVGGAESDDAAIDLTLLETKSALLGGLVMDDAEGRSIDGPDREGGQACLHV